MRKKMGIILGLGIISGSVQILLPLRAFPFQFLPFLILSVCFLLQASDSTFCTFPAFLCWNHSTTFLHPFLSFSMVSISLNCISSAVPFSFWWLCFLLPVEGSSRRVSISYISGLIPLALFSSLFFALNLDIRRLSLSLKERLLTLDLRLKRLLSLVAISSHNFPLSAFPFLV